MITLNEARALRIFGDWEGATAAFKLAHGRGFRVPERALLVRTSRASGNPYLQRAWVAQDPVANRIVALHRTADGRIVVTDAGLHGADYFAPAELPGSDAGGIIGTDPPEAEGDAPEPLTTADSEPAPFGRLVKGYKAAPEATRAPTRDLRVVPHLRLNATQAEIVARWRQRTGRTMQDFAYAAITTYIAQIADEEN